MLLQTTTNIRGDCLGFMGLAEQLQGITNRAGYMDANQLEYTPKYLVEFQLKDPSNLFNTLQASYSFFEKCCLARGIAFSKFNHFNLNSREIFNPVFREMK